MEVKPFFIRNYTKSIIESISFVKKMGVQKVVLAGADEDALLVADFLKKIMFL